MSTFGFVKAKDAGAAVAPHRIVKRGAGGDLVIQSTAAADKHLGVTTAVGTTGAGQRVDVILGGFAKLRAGGAVVAGDRLTADAQGRGVAVALTAAACFIVGVAEVDGAEGDIIDIVVAPGIHAPTA